MPLAGFTIVSDPSEVAGEVTVGARFSPRWVKYYYKFYLPRSLQTKVTPPKRMGLGQHHHSIEFLPEKNALAGNPSANKCIIAQFANFAILTPSTNHFIAHRRQE
jgi:hypothetical protein